MSNTDSIKIAIAQINPIVGDIEGNAELIYQNYEKAVAQHADLFVCPELALTGYPPEDLILMPAFCQQVMQAARELADKAARNHPGGAALIIGSPWEEEGVLVNAAVLLDDGKVVHVQPKTMLPNYGVFDEKRLFPLAAARVPSIGAGMSLAS